MEDFKKFILQIQSVDPSSYRQEGTDNYAALSQLNELALTDMLTLPKEQVLYQIQRLESICQLFVDFWTNYGTISDDARKYNHIFLKCLQLEDYFMIMPHSDLPAADITDQFLYNLLEDVKCRKRLLQNLIWSAQQAIDTNEKSVKETEHTRSETPFKSHPIFKKEIIEELYSLLKDYFSSQDQNGLIRFLNKPESGADELLLFHGNGNQLADAFKQIFEANLIVGCTKAQLNLWILNHFCYKDKEGQKKYSEKYLNDIISSDTKSCQSPILNVKKKEGGQYGIFPTQRIRRNHKKY